MTGMQPGNAARWVREVFILLGLAALAGAATKAAHAGAPAWFVQPDADGFSVSREEIRERWSDEVVWIDARPASEFSEGHHPGAVRLTLEEFDDLLFDHFDSLAGAGRPLVVYCDGARCGKSKEIAAKLRDVGLPEAYYLTGGWGVLRRG